MILIFNKSKKIKKLWQFLATLPVCAPLYWWDGRPVGPRNGGDERKNSAMSGIVSSLAQFKVPIQTKDDAEKNEEKEIKKKEDIAEWAWSNGPHGPDRKGERDDCRMKHFCRFIAVRSRMNEDLGVIHVYLLLLLFVRALGTKNVFTHSGSSSPILYKLPRTLPTTGWTL